MKYTTLLLSGVPQKVKLLDLSYCLNRLFYADDEIGSFALRDLPRDGKKRQIALDFRSGFDAIAAQAQLDSYHYKLPDGGEYTLCAKITWKEEFMRQQTSSPEPWREEGSEVGAEEPYPGLALVPIVSDSAIYQANAKLDARLELLKKQNLILRTERKVLKQKRKLKKEYASMCDNNSDDQPTTSTTSKRRRKSSPRSPATPGPQDLQISSSGPKDPTPHLKALMSVEESKSTKLNRKRSPQEESRSRSKDRSPKSRDEDVNDKRSKWNAFDMHPMDQVSMSKRSVRDYRSKSPERSPPVRRSSRWDKEHSRSRERPVSYRSRSREKLASYESRSRERPASYRSRSRERLVSYRSRSRERPASYRSRSRERLVSYRSRSRERLACYRSRSRERLSSYMSRLPGRPVSYTSRSPERDPTRKRKRSIAIMPKSPEIIRSPRTRRVSLTTTSQSKEATITKYNSDANLTISVDVIPKKQVNGDKNKTDDDSNHGKITKPSPGNVLVSEYTNTKKDFEAPVENKKNKIKKETSAIEEKATSNVELSAIKEEATSSKESAIKEKATSSKELSAIKEKSTTYKELIAIKEEATSSEEVSAIKEKATSSKELSAIKEEANTWKERAIKEEATSSKEVSAIKEKATSSKEFSAIKEEANTWKELSAIKEEPTSSKEVSAIKEKATSSKELSAIKEKVTSSKELSAIKKKVTSTKKLSVMREKASSSKELSAIKEKATTSKELSATMEEATTWKELRAIKEGATTCKELSAIREKATSSKELSAIKEKATWTKKLSVMREKASSSKQLSAIKEGATTWKELRAIKEGATTWKELRAIKEGATTWKELRAIKEGATTWKELCAIKEGATTCKELRAIKEGATTWKESAIKEKATSCKELSAVKDKVSSSKELSAIREKATSSKELSAIKEKATSSKELSAVNEKVSSSKELSAVKGKTTSSKELSAIEEKATPSNILASKYTHTMTGSKTPNKNKIHKDLSAIKEKATKSNVLVTPIKNTIHKELSANKEKTSEYSQTKVGSEKINTVTERIGNIGNNIMRLMHNILEEISLKEKRELSDNQKALINCKLNARILDRIKPLMAVKNVTEEQVVLKYRELYSKEDTLLISELLVGIPKETCVKDPFAEAMDSIEKNTISGATDRCSDPVLSTIDWFTKFMGNQHDDQLGHKNKTGDRKTKKCTEKMPIPEKINKQSIHNLTITEVIDVDNKDTQRKIEVEETASNNLSKTEVIDVDNEDSNRKNDVEKTASNNLTETEIIDVDNEDLKIKIDVDKTDFNNLTITEVIDVDNEDSQIKIKVEKTAINNLTKTEVIDVDNEDSQIKIKVEKTAINNLIKTEVIDVDDEDTQLKMEVEKTAYNNITVTEETEIKDTEADNKEIIIKDETKSFEAKSKRVTKTAFIDITFDKDFRPIPARPQFVLVLKKLLKQMKNTITTADKKGLREFPMNMFKCALRSMLRNLVAGKGYVGTSEIVKLFRAKYLKEEDYVLINQVIEDIKMGKYGKYTEAGQPEDKDEDNDDVILIDNKCDVIIVLDSDDDEDQISGKQNLDNVKPIKRELQNIQHVEAEPTLQSQDQCNIVKAEPNDYRITVAKETSQINKVITSNDKILEAQVTGSNARAFLPIKGIDRDKSNKTSSSGFVNCTKGPIENIKQEIEPEFTDAAVENLLDSLKDFDNLNDVNDTEKENPQVTAITIMTSFSELISLKNEINQRSDKVGSTSSYIEANEIKIEKDLISNTMIETNYVPGDKRYGHEISPNEGRYNVRKGANDVRNNNDCNKVIQDREAGKPNESGPTVIDGYVACTTNAKTVSRGDEEESIESITKYLDSIFY